MNFYTENFTQKNVSHTACEINEQQDLFEKKTIVCET